MKFLLPFVAILAGCSGTSFPGRVLQSVGEKNSGFAYIPLDPLAVDYDKCEDKTSDHNKILDYLPDNAVRIAIKKLNASSNASYGPFAVGIEGEEYRIV